jgi:hypothetical protein
MKITAPPEKIADLPAGTINHHWSKNVIASPDGSRLYVTVGSNSNAGENGIANEADRAAILQIDPATGQSRICLRPAQSERPCLACQQGARARTNDHGRALALAYRLLP